MRQTVVAIVAAAGSGTRMGGDLAKQFLLLAGLPIITRACSVLETVAEVDGVVVVTPPGQEDEVRRRYLEPYPLNKIKTVTGGGALRQDSVKMGVEAALKLGAQWVVVHDGARPLAGAQLFSRVLEGARSTGAAVTAVPCQDTVKEGDGRGRVVRTLDRDRLWLVQTPQAFKTDILWKAILRAEEEGFQATDEGGLMEWAGHEVGLVMGESHNIKITAPQDLRLAQAWLQGEKEDIRQGQGIDVHRLVQGRPLVLGGVRLEHELGLAGHSDADVLTHAVMDALLAAAGLGDIGRHFPDSDPKFKDADSLVLLQEVVKVLGRSGWRPQQVSVTLMAQRPKIAPHAKAMSRNLADCLGLDTQRVNVAATTSEGLGFTGREEGMAAWATAMITRLPDQGG